MTSVPPYEVSIKIPFPTRRQAEVAYDVLRVDEEPRRGGVFKTLSLEDSKLIVYFSGEQAKNVRVGMTSFFESLILCCETLDQFGSPTEKYEFY